VFAPNDRRYFDLFDEAGQNMVRAAELLDRMMRGWPDSYDLARSILVCEQDGDRITHNVMRGLNETFVTPIDREDIYALVSSIDDVVDFIEEVADFLGLYRVEAPMLQACELSGVLLQAVGELAQALSKLRSSREDLSRELIEVHRLENDGDRIFREAVAALFRTSGVDPLTIIRWKDILERLEAAIDAVEQAANIVGGIVIKNS
jgi:predicted phosphate transport protein (TIGR00153 family)